MSLLDALLLEPYPFDVWIAYRTDGIAGSGTASDPFDGSPQYETVNITGFTTSGFEATVTAAGHGLSNGEAVTITGLTGAAPSFLHAPNGWDWSETDQVIGSLHP